MPKIKTKTTHVEVRDGKQYVVHVLEDDWRLDDEASRKRALFASLSPADQARQAAIERKRKHRERALRRAKLAIARRREPAKYATFAEGFAAAAAEIDQYDWTEPRTLGLDG